MSHMYFRLIVYSVVAWMSRNSLFETGVLSEVSVTAKVFEDCKPSFDQYSNNITERSIRKIHASFWAAPAKPASFWATTYLWNPANTYLFKINDISTTKRCEIYLKITIKPQEWRHWHCFDVFIVTSECILHLFLVFLLLTQSI